MLSAMLLGLLAVGATARDPDPPVRIWFDHKDESYLRGERVKVFVKTASDAYLVIFQVDPENRLRVLFPLDPGDDNYVRGGKTYKVMGRGGREGFVTDVPGRGIIFAAVSPDPYRFQEFTSGNYWDYHAFNAKPIQGDPEQVLVELAQAMTASRFDFDILRYGTYADASDLAPGTDLVYEVEPAFNGCLGCAPVSTVVVTAGVPVYCTSSLYDPLCYDPLYWSPGYVPPAYWNVGWGWYGGYYGPVYATAWHGPGYYPAIPVSPYSAKTWDRQWSGEAPAYRPRAQGRYVNTVVAPLPSTGRILKADPRRSWGGTIPVAAPAVATAPDIMTTRDREVERPASTPATGSEQRRREPPAPHADPRTRRSWSDGTGSTSGGSQQASPQTSKPSAAENGGGSKSSPPPQAAPRSGSGSSTPTQASSGGGRRRG